MLCFSSVILISNLMKTKKNNFEKDYSYHVRLYSFIRNVLIRRLENRNLILLQQQNERKNGFEKYKEHSDTRQPLYKRCSTF